MFTTPGETARRRGRETYTVTIFDLVEAIGAVLKRVADKTPRASSCATSRWQNVSRGYCARWRASGRIQFAALFEDAGDRSLVIATFIALLELIRRREVRAFQEARFGPIFLERAAAAMNGGRVEEERLKSILASLLFAAGEPVSLARLAAVFDDLPRATVQKALAAMAAEYSAENRGIVIDEVAGGYQMRTPKDHAGYVRKLLAAKPPRLSWPLMETVAIIAYRQPITRPEIEQLRGVNTGGYSKRCSNAGWSRLPGARTHRDARWSTKTTDEFPGIVRTEKSRRPARPFGDSAKSERAVEQATTGPVEGIETHPEDVVAVDPTLSDEVGSSSAGEQQAESGPRRDPSSDDDDKTSR